jgi:hypothetical protein
MLLPHLRSRAWRGYYGDCDCDCDCDFLSHHNNNNPQPRRDSPLLPLPFSSTRPTHRWRLVSLPILTIYNAMPNLALDATDDLISLADSAEGSNPKSPVRFGSIGRKMPETRRNVQRDSFSDLAGLMKAKKPYTTIPPPTPRSSLSPATNGESWTHVVGR